MKQQLPTLEEEEILWSRGHNIVIGIDEVGRGPLAGPVVAAACYFRFESEKARKEIEELGIKDSKFVLPKKRKKIFDLLKDNGSVKYGIGIVDEKMIDKINVLQASLLAMKIALENLKLQTFEGACALIDGRDVIPNVSIDQKAIIKGDGKVLSIAAASILAKVTRDEVMEKYAVKYPEYSFEKHKGYGTKLHLEAIKEHGACEIHRKTFLH